MTEGEPGYCMACGGFHMLTPVPEWGGSACGQCVATRRLDPPDEEGSRHVCNTGSRHKHDRPDYRRCSCGQWFHSGGGYWYRVNHPPARWLREHGMDPGEFWDLDDEHGTAWFEEVSPGRPSLRLFLRWLFSGRPLPSGDCLQYPGIRLPVRNLNLARCTSAGPQLSLLQCGRRITASRARVTLFP